MAGVALAASAAVAQVPIKIAVVGPPDGQQGQTTRAIESGTQAAVATLAQSSSGSNPPVMYAITVKDDGCDAAKAETVAKEIVSENFDLVLGHPCAKAALAAAKIYASAGVTFIATQTRHPDLTAKRAGPSIFRLSGRDDAQGLDAARYLTQAHGARPIAIVHDRTLYAKTIAEQAEAALKAQKQIIVPATIIAGDKDYAKLIAKIKDAGAVFFAGFPMEAGFILQQLRAAGSTAPFLAAESVATEEFTSTFGGIAKDVYVLRATEVTTPSERAMLAVNIFSAIARRHAFGPAKDAAGQRALVNASLANYRDPAFGLQDGFDTAGNARLNSYDLLRWDGTLWQRQQSLR